MPPAPCLICDRVRLCRQRDSPYFIHEFAHSYFVIGDYQYHPGYALMQFVTPNRGYTTNFAPPATPVLHTCQKPKGMDSYYPYRSIGPSPYVEGGPAYLAYDDPAIGLNYFKPKSEVYHPNSLSHFRGAVHLNTRTHLGRKSSPAPQKHHPGLNRPEGVLRHRC